MISPVLFFLKVQFSSVQSLSHVQLFVTLWTAACQASLSITNSQSLLKLMSIELVMPSNHLILCHPLLLLPSIFLSIRLKPRQCVKKQRHHFANKGAYRQNDGFSSSHVWMWELDYKESWALKNWCFWTVVLKKTLESLLDFKEIQPVHPKDQSCVFIGRTDAEAEAPVLWPPNVKNWLIGKDPDAGRDWGKEEKGTTENEMIQWQHWFNGYKFEQALGVDGQGSLVCYSPWGHKKSDVTEQLNWC